MLRNAFRLFGAACLVGGVAAASATPVLIDFEGANSGVSVGGYYGGGTDGGGGSGPDYGITFSPNALALDEDSPLSNFANAPSSPMVMYFATGTAYMNVASGFVGTLSLHYTTTTETGVVSIFDGLNGTGTRLGFIDLAALGNGTDPENAFSNWDEVMLSFAGTARSIEFGGPANMVAFDNITIDIAAPSAVPEAPTLALALAALAALGAARRRAG